MGFFLLCSQVLTLYSFLIIARVLISWVSPDPRNPVVQFLHRATEPLLGVLRKLVPPQLFGGLDLSPMMAFIVLSAASRVVATLARTV
jgi:YggT family protein